jgi:hypothetical protein
MQNNANMAVKDQLFDCKLGWRTTFTLKNGKKDLGVD